jgi:hypothetical protein
MAAMKNSRLENSATAPSLLASAMRAQLQPERVSSKRVKNFTPNGRNPLKSLDSKK